MSEALRPATDWGKDFDILDPDYIAHPDRYWAEMREQCPVPFSERHGSSWMPVRYADIAAVAHDTDHFSSRDIAVITPFEGGMDFISVPPITSDPPVHTWARRLLLPAFGPSAIERMTPITRELANELLDEIVAKGEADVAADYARRIPMRVIALMLGVPTEDETLFTTWVVRLLQEGLENIDKAMGTLTDVMGYFVEKVAARRAVPAAERPDDLITLLVESEHEGEPLPDDHVVGTCFLLLIAGIDTTWSAISSSLWHLATHPEDQARLRAEPELMPLAVEEFLRFYSPVTMARETIADTEINGCPVRAGDKVILAFPAGNRDPEAFERADEFVIDRARNRHFAFGSGVHRCLGSNLARMELTVSIEEFLKRVPTFELSDPAAVSWTGGQVRGARVVPIRF